MTKLLSMNAVNKINQAIKALGELIVALSKDVYGNRLLILGVDGMINQLKSKLKP